MASPFRCIDLTCCKAVALEEARGRQSSPSADAGRLRVLYRLSARTALGQTRPVFACVVTASLQRRRGPTAPATPA